jgi:hypothetical protein
VQAANAQANATRSSGASTKPVPKTPWGHPDLQGVWTTDEEIGVPLERPVELGNKAVLTEAEYRQRVEMLKKRYQDNKEDRTREVGNGRLPCTGTRRPRFHRTSLIVVLTGEFPYPEARNGRQEGTELIRGSWKGPTTVPDLALTDRYHPRPAADVVPERIQQRLPDRAVAGYGHHLVRAAA